MRPAGHLVVEYGRPTRSAERFLGDFRLSRQLSIKLGQFLILRCQGCRLFQVLLSCFAQFSNLPLKCLSLGCERFKLFAILLLDGVKSLRQRVAEGRRWVIASSIGANCQRSACYNCLCLRTFGYCSAPRLQPGSYPSEREASKYPSPIPSSYWQDRSTSFSYSLVVAHRLK